MLPLQLLRVSVHERISAAAADFVLLLEKGKEAAEIPELRALLTERLTAAAEEIVGLLEQTVAEYEDKAERAEQEMSRQRKLLNILLKPQVRLHRAALSPDVQQLSIKKEESGLDQEEPEAPPIKEEEEEQLQDLTTFPVKSEDDEEEAGAETRDRESGSDSLRNTRSHLSGVASPFVCSLCGNRFGRKDHLKRHMRLHTGEKPFHCSVCRKEFHQAGNLQAHMRIHTGEKPFSCSFCHKSFSQSGAMHRHVRIHTGEKPFLCSVCRKSFRDTGCLTKHTRFHTGEKPYRCGVCGKSCYCRSNIRRHRCGG